MHSKKDINKLRDQIIGLGEESIRKSYYPKLQYHIDELERFRAILDQSQDMILIVDMRTDTIVDINYAVCMMYQKEKKHILGSVSKDFFPLDIKEHLDIIYRGNQEELRNCCIVQTQILTPKGNVPIEFSLQKIEFENASYIVIIGTNITERKKIKEKLHKLDYFDSLTTLPNKKMFHKCLNAIKTKNIFSSVLLIDLDNFKTINDTKGHKVGDKLLNQVCSRLMKMLDKSHQLFRTGGDEFLILHENIDNNLDSTIELIDEFASSLKSALNVTYNLDNDKFFISSSIGIEVFKNSDFQKEDVLKHAEIAMYEAKNSGRDAICFYDKAMQEALKDKIKMEIEIKAALEKNEFVLYYQPQLSVDQKIIGLEALVRWNHSKKGLIPPNLFIPIAEDNGFIINLGEWVLQTACRQLHEFSKNEKTKELKISVNVSIKQLQDHDFIDKLKNILNQAKITNSNLILELTESIFIQDIAQIIKTMEKIQDLGVLFSMDDFGTGYSSLSSLKRLPLYELKVDQSFVRDITVDNNDAIIVKTIIGMAKNLGLKVVAEGVETQSQFEYLQKYDCDIYQGYLFSKPRPIYKIYGML